MAKKDNDEKQPIIIIKKVKKISAGHHGGAWKVAYADFVTAMMAFFLLMWLLNVTTKEEKELISSYFAPTDPRISQSESGSGGVMGGTTMSTEGAMSQTRVPVSSPADPEGTEGKEGEEATEQGLQEGQKSDSEKIAEMDRRDEKSFEDVEQKIKQAIEQLPELKAIAQNILMDMTPEGLRIQIVDQEGKPMFETGSAKPMPETEKLLRVITQVIQSLPNKISIRGHTDSRPYGKDNTYGNWELSADRANASRRVMLGRGIGMNLEPTRIENVQGKADREPLVPNDPASARNRRISIILLKQSISPGLDKPVPSNAVPRPQAPATPQPRKREEGVIYFP